jgi:hypothetical protein
MIQKKNDPVLRVSVEELDAMPGSDPSNFIGGLGFLGPFFSLASGFSLLKFVSKPVKKNTKKNKNKKVPERKRGFG